MNKSTSLVIILMIFLSLTGCSVGIVDVEQESATGLVGELLDGHSYGQSFVMKYDGLYRIDLYTATYARENTHSVIFRICSSPTCHSGEVLVKTELPATLISNSGPTIISFTPIAGIAERTLYFSIESPGSVAGDAITVYRDDKDIYPDGQMFIDGQPSEGDLAFIAYTNETFTVANIWNNFYSRASQDKAFFRFYGSLLVILLFAVIAIQIWHPKPRIPTGSDEQQSNQNDAGGKVESQD